MEEELADDLSEVDLGRARAARSKCPPRRSAAARQDSSPPPPPPPSMSPQRREILCSSSSQNGGLEMANDGRRSGSGHPGALRRRREMRERLLQRRIPSLTNSNPYCRSHCRFIKLVVMFLRGSSAAHTVTLTRSLDSWGRAAPNHET